MSHLLRRFAALAAVAALAAGCAAGAASTAADVDDFVGLMGGAPAGYVAAKSPAELAAWSEVVVDGTIERFQDGRIWGETRESAAYTVVMVVKVTNVYKGSLPRGSNGRVYVEFLSGGRVRADAYDKAAPRDANVLLYLIPDWKETPGNPPLLNPTAGRPKGQPLWDLTTPQGFFLATPSGAVLQARDFASYPDASIGQFLPDNEQWPTYVGSPTEGEPPVPPG